MDRVGSVGIKAKMDSRGGHVFIVEKGERVPQGFNVYAQELHERKLVEYNKGLTGVIALRKLELYSEPCEGLAEHETSFVLGHCLSVKVLNDD